MKWFKHLSGSLNNSIISEAVERFGGDGYMVFFGILEMVSDEFDIYNPGIKTLRMKKITKNLQLSRQKTVKILRFFDEKAKINTEKDVSFLADIQKHDVVINCKRLAELCDTHTKKLLADTSKLLQSNIEVTSSLETEAETEAEEDVKRRTQTPPFLKPDNKHFEQQVGEYFQGIKTKCETILKLPAKKGRPFNPFEWIQEKVNKARHPGAMDETFAAMIDGWEGIDNPYGWANTILATKNGNWIEKDNIIKSKEKWLIIKEKMAEMFKGFEVGSEKSRV